MDMLRGIGIIGTRKRNVKEDYDMVCNAFAETYVEGDFVVSGGCPKGGDYFAGRIAGNLGIPILIFYPNWKEYGKAAGFIRNEKIAQHSTRALIACVTTDRTGGTEDTIKKYKKFCKEMSIEERLILV